MRATFSAYLDTFPRFKIFFKNFSAVNYIALQLLQILNHRIRVSPCFIHKDGKRMMGQHGPELCQKNQEWLIELKYSNIIPQRTQVSQRTTKVVKSTTKDVTFVSVTTNRLFST